MIYVGPNTHNHEMDARLDGDCVRCNYFAVIAFCNVVSVPEGLRQSLVLREALLNIVNVLLIACW